MAMKFTNFQKKYTIKIPENVTTFYCDKKKIITFSGPLKKKSLKLEVKPFFSNPSNLLIISDLSNTQNSISGKKKAKIMQGTTLAIIKHALIEINYQLYNKVKFVGVGYRSFQMNNPLEDQIFLKLGYSHMIYFRIPSPLNTHVVKFTTLFIFGNSSYSEITKLVSLIRDCRLPEPYKGKGVLRYEEKISLKKGKKI
jgi:large subunit ribosomal protein L6